MSLIVSIVIFIATKGDKQMNEQEMKLLIINILNDIESENNDGGINCGDFIHAYESIKELVFVHSAQENKSLQEKVNSLEQRINILQPQPPTPPTPPTGLG